MATVPFDAHIDLQHNELLNALLHPVAADPANPTNGQVWLNTSEGRLKVRAGGVTNTLATTSDVTAGSITGALWNAHTLVKADVDDTPVPMTVATGTLVGRLVGENIKSVTPAEIRTLIGVESGATADQTATEILTKLLTVDGPASGLDADTLDGTQLTALATKVYVDGQISGLVESAPGTLDTLNELAEALGDDPNFAATVTAELAQRPSKFATAIGDGAATQYLVSHALGSLDVIVSVRDATNGQLVLVDWRVIDANTIRVDFNGPPDVASRRVVVVG